MRVSNQFKNLKIIDCQFEYWKHSTTSIVDFWKEKKNLYRNLIKLKLKANSSKMCINLLHFSDSNQHELPSHQKFDSLIYKKLHTHWSIILLSRSHAKQRINRDIIVFNIILIHHIKAHNSVINPTSHTITLINRNKHGQKQTHFLVS